MLCIHRCSVPRPGSAVLRRKRPRRPGASAGGPAARRAAAQARGPGLAGARARRHRPNAASESSATRPSEDGGQNFARDFRLWVAATRAISPVIRDGAAQIPGRAGADRPGARRRDPGQGPLADRHASPSACSCSAMAASRPTGRRRAAGASMSWPCRSTRSSSASTWSAFASATTCSGCSASPLGSLGALLLFSWPPLLKTILSAVFLIIVVALLWGALARFLLSPHNRRAARLSDRRRLRPALEPLERDPARLVLRRLDRHAGPAATSTWIRPVRQPIAYALGLLLFVLAMMALWRRPALSHPIRSSAATAPATSRSPCPCCSRPSGCFGCSAHERPSGCSWSRPACPPRPASSTGRWTMS